MEELHARRMQKKLKGKKKKNHKTVLWLVLSLLFLILTLLGLRFYGQLQSFMSQIYHQVQTEDLRGKSVELSQGQPISTLLLGVDTGVDQARDIEEGGRTDTMMVLTLNPQDQSAYLVSVPRDTYAEIVGYDLYDKINHSYAYGGISMTVNSIQQLLQIPIDYYLEVNMEGLKALVDAVGGVDVDNPFAFTFDDLNFPQGPQHLDGMYALAYARMRYEDPEGDFGRQKRQQQVIKGLLAQAISLDSLSNYQAIFEALSSKMRTNLSFDDLSLLQENYLPALNNFQQLTIQEHGMTVLDASVQYASKVELHRISSLLRANLLWPSIALEDFPSVYVPGMSETYDLAGSDQSLQVPEPTYGVDVQGNLYEITTVFSQLLGQETYSQELNQEQTDYESSQSIQEGGL